MDEFAYEAGLARTTFLGLSVPDWINLGISLAWIVGGYLLGTLLIRRVLPRLVKRSNNQFAGEVLDTTGSDLRWLVVVLLAQFATTRLAFVFAELKAVLPDAYYVLGLAIVVRILWRVIDLADEWYRQRPG